ncbi:hypothetical protein L596_025901 [Steinernema carpocapsae]|uniref:Integrase catalytic domain-containing protein n=1 Tax=Steinernema carpocapsae TaxID=34508 RepID=A0A4U5M938_STECR|nr:hypothetical protein L596_025901 [Steinernema carpocapsae]
MHGIQKLQSIPYWKQGNSQIEQTFRSMHLMMKKLMHENEEEFDTLLMHCQWIHNTSAHEAHGQIPYELVYGRTPVNSPEF